MPFKLYDPKRFRIGKLDVFVVTVIFIVFIWAFYVDSFRPIVNETGDPIIIITDTGEHTIPHINMQVFLAPLIMCYEMLVLVGLDGKLKGRELPWGMYFVTFKLIVINKLREGIEEYCEWKQNNNIKNK